MFGMMARKGRALMALPLLGPLRDLLAAHEAEAEARAAAERGEDAATETPELAIPSAEHCATEVIGPDGTLTELPLRTGHGQFRADPADHRDHAYSYRIDHPGARRGRESAVRDQHEP